MTKLCTGPRYAGETQTLAAINGWHGCYGHFNVLELDQESACTGYGKHDRICAFVPEGNTCEARIDTLWNLGNPSDSDIIRAAKARNGDDMRGRWKVISREPWDDGSAITVTMQRI